MRKVDLAACDKVIVFDPARSRESEYGRQARNAIGTFAADVDYNVYVLTYWCGRGNVRQWFEEIKRQVDQFHPRCIGVEDVAVQMSIGEGFSELARSENYRLPPIESLRPDTRINKKFRVKTNLQLVAPYGKFYILKSMHELKAEWLGFPNGRTIDILDICAYAIQLLNIPTSAFAGRNERLKRAAMNRGYEINEADENVINLDAYRVPPPPEDVKPILRYA